MRLVMKRGDRKIQISGEYTNEYIMLYPGSSFSSITTKDVVFIITSDDESKISYILY